MELFVALKNSLKLPTKTAMFRLNRMSMRNTLVYLFLLLFITFIPEFILQTMLENDIWHKKGIELYILQLVVLYPMFCIFLGIAGISLLASIGLLFAIVVKRKLAYQQIWKMTVYAATYPLLTYFVLTLFKLHVGMIIWIILFMLYLILFAMILNYPRRKHK